MFQKNINSYLLSELTVVNKIMQICSKSERFWVYFSKGSLKLYPVATFREVSELLNDKKVNASTVKVEFISYPSSFWQKYQKFSHLQAFFVL